MLFSFVFISVSTAQDSVAKREKVYKELKTSINVMNRYIWRGQAWGGNFIVAQPEVEYTHGNWTFGIWGTTNFRKDYFYSDGITPNNGYHELDLSLTYTFWEVFSVSLTDYYWPSLTKVEGSDTSYSNYGSDGVKTVDMIFELDYTEKENYPYPFKMMVSTFIAGNDFRYDTNGNSKRNFTTYGEVSYVFKNVLCSGDASKVGKIDLQPTVGAVFNNQAQYYTAGDYNKVSLVNLGLEAKREFDFDSRFKMPISLSFVHNAAQSNTEPDGRNFLLVGVSLVYEKNNE